MYMAGCLVGPFVATGVASANVDSKWYLFYLFPLGVGVVNLAFVGVSFRDRMATPTVLRSERGGRIASNSALKEIKDTLSTPGVWLLSLFFFFFLGATITAGGLSSLACFSACSVFCKTDCIRLDGRVPCQRPQRRRQSNGLYPSRLLRRRLSRTSYPR